MEYCKDAKRKCSLLVGGKCVAKHKEECPEWQDTHDAEMMEQGG